VACNDGCDPINPPEPPVVQKFTVVGIADSNGSITPSSAIVEKGQSATFTMKPDPGYLIECIKDNGAILAPVSIYTIYNVTKDDTFEVTFKKDSLLYPLLRITWKEDGTFSLMNGEWVQWDDPYMEVVNFNSDGTYSNVWNGGTYQGLWSLDKTKNPAILVYGGNHWTIEVLTEEKMSISYTNTQGIITRNTYVNGGYK